MADIKKRTAVVSMLVLGVLAIIYSISSFIIDLTPSTFGIVGLGIGVVLLSEIGIKRLSRFSRLRRLSNQQYISLVLAVVVILTSFGMVFGFDVPVLGDIANGSFLSGGVFIILEAVSF